MIDETEKTLRHGVIQMNVETFAGLALAAISYVLLLVVILLPLQIKNARRERTVLREKFGERYELYRRATWF